MPLCASNVHHNRKRANGCKPNEKASVLGSGLGSLSGWRVGQNEILSVYHSSIDIGLHPVIHACPLVSELQDISGQKCPRRRESAGANGMTVNTNTVSNIIGIRGGQS